jgi:hypothetical protein
MTLTRRAGVLTYCSKRRTQRLAAAPLVLPAITADIFIKRRRWAWIHAVQNPEMLMAYPELTHAMNDLLANTASVRRIATASER